MTTDLVPAGLRLVPYADADIWLTRTLETDPDVMRELGGAWPEEAIAGIHERRLAAIARGAWVLNIVVGADDRVVGGVSLWASEWEGQPSSEAGWMILPAFQGRGYARPAVRMLLQRAHADGHWGVIDAFPGTANAASNAICRGAGFRMLGEVDIDYGGRRLRCNHWRLPAPA